MGGGLEEEKNAAWLGSCLQKSTGAGRGLSDKRILFSASASAETETTRGHLRRPEIHAPQAFPDRWHRNFGPCPLTCHLAHATCGVVLKGEVERKEIPCGPRSVGWLAGSEILYSRALHDTGNAPRVA